MQATKGRSEEGVLQLLDLRGLGIAVVLQQRYVLAALGKSEGNNTSSCGHVQHSRWLGIVPIDEILVAPTNDQLQGYKLTSAPSDRGCKATLGPWCT